MSKILYQKRWPVEVDDQYNVCTCIWQIILVAKLDLQGDGAVSAQMVAFSNEIQMLLKRAGFLEFAIFAIVSWIFLWGLWALNIHELCDKFWLLSHDKL